MTLRAMIAAIMGVATAANKYKMSLLCIQWQFGANGRTVCRWMSLEEAFCIVLTLVERTMVTSM